VVIADDESLVRRGLSQVLGLDSGLEVVGEAHDGADALTVIRAHRPDVALVDIRMPVMDGIETTRRVSADSSLAAVRIIVLTTFTDDDLVVAAVRAGASGYLLKSMPPEQIRQGVHLAAQGQMALAPELVGRLLKEYSQVRAPRSPLLDRLTPRETDVLRAVAAGGSNAEIARSLYLSEGTVKTHVASVLAKLALRDRTQAAIAAYELGLVRADRGSPGGG
jgi:DNA-binding NarL/FixJ family response regulator